MAATDISTDVLIVGAGPTGLTLACTLAQRGVGFRIVDAAKEPFAGSRGKGLQPRSLELFDDLGIVKGVIENGVFDMPVRSHDEAGRAITQPVHAPRLPRPDAPYLSSLLTPQFRTEEALRGKLEQLGGRVEFGVELTGFAQDDMAVTAQLNGAPVRARWLVGCDGGKSTVRHGTGISFLGETLENVRMLVADVHATGIGREYWNVWKSATGFLALCPLPSTDRFQLQASIAPNQESDATLELLQRITAQRTGRDDIRLSDPSWMSLWRANVRMVDRYSRGNVFLAGDAAHVHSPAGGQGMNTGIQDAYNLGWKLAAVLRGADAALLDTYSAERLPIAAWVLGISNQLLQATIVAGTIAFQRDEQTLQLGLGYRDSSLTRELRADVAGLRAGDRAPEAPGLSGPNGPVSMFDLLRGPHATLLGFGARWQPLIDSCVTRFKDRVRGYVIAPEHIADTQGHARAAYAADALFVVRPDNYVGLATHEIDAAPVIEYLKRICGA